MGGNNTIRKNKNSTYERLRKRNIKSFKKIKKIKVMYSTREKDDRKRKGKRMRIRDKIM